MCHKPELLDAVEMAERLRIRPDTLRLWGRTGVIPRVRINDKIVRYDAVEVIEHLRRSSPSQGVQP